MMRETSRRTEPAVYLGSICKRNHDGTRYQKGGACVACVRDLAKNSYQQDREQRIQKQIEYAKANADKVAAYQRGRKKWHYQENKEKYLSYCHSRRARMYENGGSYTAADIQHLFETQGGLCNVCKQHLAAYEIDHIVPLSKGGSNWPANLQLLCRHCNRTKADK